MGIPLKAPAALPGVGAEGINNKPQRSAAAEGGFCKAKLLRGSVGRTHSHQNGGASCEHAAKRSERGAEPSRKLCLLARWPGASAPLSFAEGIPHFKGGVLFVGQTISV